MDQLLFISCIPGLEPILEQELNQLGMTIRGVGFGGVFLPFRDFKQIYELNLLLRSASRVLMPLTYFDCKDRDDLYRHTMNIDWLPFFKLLPTFAIDAHVQHKAFTHTLFAAQVVKDAICDQLRKKLGERPSIDTENPKVRLNLFIQNNQATLSFDTTGRALHERGYRLDGGEAPLRENLAAAVVLLSGYTGDKILVDPCCGSGTLLIEAALIASKTPSQYLRQSFGFMHHPEYSHTLWMEVRKEAIAKKIPLQDGHFIGIEKSAKTYSLLQKAIAKAGFEGKIKTILSDFRATNIDLSEKPNFVITNPPYGIRLEEVEELSILYKDIGTFMKEKTAKPARGFILTASPELSKKIGLKATRRHIVNNGGIECRFLEYDLY